MQAFEKSTCHSKIKILCVCIWVNNENLTNHTFTLSRRDVDYIHLRNLIYTCIALSVEFPSLQKIICRVFVSVISRRYELSTFRDVVPHCMLCLVIKSFETALRRGFILFVAYSSELFNLGNQVHCSVCTLQSLVIVGEFIPLIITHKLTSNHCRI